MLNVIRNHWGIENSFHWILDVIFNEDKSQIKDKNAACNIATMRRFALTLIKNAKNPKNSIKLTKKIATWSGAALKNPHALGPG